MSVVVPGVVNKTLVASCRIMPPRLVTRIVAAAMAAERIESAAQDLAKPRGDRLVPDAAGVGSRAARQHIVLD